MAYPPRMISLMALTNGVTEVIVVDIGLPRILCVEIGEDHPNKDVSNFVVISMLSHEDIFSKTQCNIQFY
jgi:hypothetical protein